MSFFSDAIHDVISPAGTYEALGDMLDGDANSNDYSSMLSHSLFTTGEPIAITTGLLQEKYGTDFMTDDPTFEGEVPQLAAATEDSFGELTASEDNQMLLADVSAVEKRLRAAGMSPAAAAAAGARMHALGAADLVGYSTGLMGDLEALRYKIDSKADDYDITSYLEAGTKGFLDGV